MVKVVFLLSASAPYSLFFWARLEAQRRVSGSPARRVISYLRIPEQEM